MKIEINGTVYNLKFGIGFMSEMNKKYGLSAEGINIGKGTEMALGKIALYDLPALADVIQVSSTGGLTPSIEDIENWLINEETDVQKVIDNFLKELENQPLIKKVMKLSEEQARKLSESQQ